MIIAGIYFIASTLSCFNIDWPILSHIGGMSFLTLAFLYLTSYVFRFCAYHRMFLHYILLTDIINYIDYYYGIPIGMRGMLVLNFSLAGLTLFLIIYFRSLCQNQKDS